MIHDNGQDSSDLSVDFYDLMDSKKQKSSVKEEKKQSFNYDNQRLDFDCQLLLDDSQDRSSSKEVMIEVDFNNGR